MIKRKGIYIFFCISIICWMAFSPLAIHQAFAKYPEKPFRFIVSSTPGGGVDILMRAVAEVLQKEKIINVPITFEYKVGGGLAIGMDYAASQRGNPYVLYPISAQFFTLPILGTTKSNVDDFTVICNLASDPFLVHVRKDYEYQTIHELVEGAKKNPGQIRWGGVGHGGGDRIIMMMLGRKTGTSFNYIPFQGPPQIVTSLLGKHIDVSSNQLNESYAQLMSGDFKPLAICSGARMVEHLPNVPTMIESGIDIEESSYRGVVAPADIPQEAYEFLQEAFKRLDASPLWKQIYIDKFTCMREYRDGANFTKFIKERIMPEYTAIYEELGLIKKK